MDAALTINVKINEDSVGFTLAASERNGWRVNTGIFTVVLTTAAAWEVTFAS